VNVSKADIDHEVCQGFNLRQKKHINPWRETIFRRRDTRNKISSHRYLSLDTEKTMGRTTEGHAFDSRKCNGFGSSALGPGRLWNAPMRLAEPKGSSPRGKIAEV
jgi:hypothetical protein